MQNCQELVTDGPRSTSALLPSESHEMSAKPKLEEAAAKLI